MLAVVVVLAAGLQYTSHRQTADAHKQANGVVIGVTKDLPSDSPHVLQTPAARPAPHSSGGGSAPAPSTNRSVIVDSTQQALINADRRAHGLAPLAWSSCLLSIAVTNARRITAQGYLSDANGPSADLSCGLGSRSGENVGSWSLGVNDSQLNTMFMNSPQHYANIMGPYHYVATAWAVASNGSAYIAVEFS